MGTGTFAKNRQKLKGLGAKPVPPTPLVEAQRLWDPARSEREQGDGAFGGRGSMRTPRGQRSIPGRRRVKRVRCAKAATQESGNWLTADCN